MSFWNGSGQPWYVSLWPINQSVRHPVSQSVNQLVSQANSQSVSQLVNQFPCFSVNLFVCFSSLSLCLCLSVSVSVHVCVVPSAVYCIPVTFISCPIIINQGPLSLSHSSVTIAKTDSDQSRADSSNMKPCIRFCKTIPPRPWHRVWSQTRTLRRLIKPKLQTDPSTTVSCSTPIGFPWLSCSYDRYFCTNGSVKMPPSARRSDFFDIARHCSQGVLWTNRTR